MRFLIVSHAYADFLEALYASTPDLASRNYDEQMDAYFNTLFATSDFYSRALRELGHQASEIICNNAVAQERWSWENSEIDSRDKWAAIPETVTQFPEGNNWRNHIQIVRRMLARTPVRYVKPLVQSYLRRLDSATSSRLFEIFIRQVQKEKPDVLLVQSVYAFPDRVLKILKEICRYLVGEHAATTLNDDIDWRLYDLIVSSFPPTVEFFKSRGVRAELNRLAFDPRVLALLPSVPRDVPMSFTGNFFRVHSSRLEFIEQVARRVPELHVWGNSQIPIAAGSPLRRRMRGAVWGRDMFSLLARSRLTLNHHGDVLPFANNMRLYEATGMGALLLTDWKENLGEMFEPDREVITYRDAEECADKAAFYLSPEHESERQRIAEAGHRRTMSEHTYLNRMRRLVSLIESL